MRNLLFYKYVEIDDLKTFRSEHQQLLESLNLKGKVLIASEGINGCITGEEQDCASYKKALSADPRFADMPFKDTFAPAHGFKKTIVRIRKEIVSSGTSVSLHNRAQYIEPEELKELIDKNKDVILLDARNNYESEIGRFKGAITPDLSVFRDFTQVAKDLAHLKDKQVVTYCTGGIRCEKASAILKDHGFTNVRQLHGGIIRYGEEVGDAHWEGSCFVFDGRGAIPIDPQSQAIPITNCSACSLPSDKYYNCKRERCDARFISCPACVERLEGYCTKNCKNRHAFDKPVVVLSADERQEMC